MGKLNALAVLVAFIVHSSLYYDLVYCNRDRKTFEVIIGGNDGPPPAPSPEISQECPPPPPPQPNCPPPPPPQHCTCPPPIPPVSPPPPPLSPPSPPPIPPASPPPPSIFVSKWTEMAFKAIQNLRKKISYDPQNITNTWKGKDVCKYQGYKCENLPDKDKKPAVAGVDFNGYNFNGDDLKLDGFLDKMLDLGIFHANSINFSGTIPQNIKKLRFLYELDVSNNKLYGCFPTALLGTNLSFLDIRFNQFSGILPYQAFNMPYLEVFFINNNNFNQKLPKNLGSLRASYVTFANNKFSGEIPSSIGQARKTLLQVLFLNNQFSGCLPSEIGLLDQTTIFDVGNNQLTGQIPLSFQCLDNMMELNLAQNKFYGPVPEEICMLPYMMNLSLSYNYFTQVGPACRKLIQQNILDVRMNCILDLPAQRSPAQCAEFFTTKFQCPKEKYMSTWIPCKDKSGSKYQSQNFEDQRRVPTASRKTYDALVPPPRMP